MAVVLATLSVVSMASEPVAPGDEAEVLLRLSPSTIAARALIRDRDTTPFDGDADPGTAVARAIEHLRLARRDGDPRHYGYAQGALAPWWSDVAPPKIVQRTRAMVRQAQHDFDGALLDLEAVLARDPQDAQALLVRATILRVQGRRRDSRRTCGDLRPVASRLVVITCMAAAASSDAELSWAWRRLRAALTRSPHAAPTVKQWAHGILGELAIARGEPEAALDAFRAAVALPGAGVHLKAAYADALLATGQAEAVLATLDAAPVPDPLRLRICLAARTRGDVTAEHHCAAVQERRQDLRRRATPAHDRRAIRAALELDEAPAEALDLALRSWGIQREPEDARLVLAAAVAAGTPARARVVLDWMQTEAVEHAPLQELRARLSGSPASTPVNHHER